MADLNIGENINFDEQSLKNDFNLQAEQEEQERNTNFKINEERRKKSEVVALTTYGALGQFVIFGKYSEGHVNHEKIPFLDRWAMAMEHGTKLKFIPKEGTVEILTERDKKILSEMEEASKKRQKDPIKEIFGKDISNDFNAVANALDREFDLKTLKESGILDPNFSFDKCVQIKKDLIAEKKELITNGIDKNEAERMVVESMISRMELGKSLGLQNTAEDLANLRLAEINGFATKEEIENLVGGSGPKAMASVKEAIAAYAVANNKKMYDIGAQNNRPIEVDPKSYSNRKDDRNRKKEVPSLEEELEELKRETKAALDQTEQNNEIFDNDVLETNTSFDDMDM